MDKTFVLICPIIQNFSLSSLSNNQRIEEINKTKNNLSKSQKYTVFKLLEYALKKLYNTNIEDTSISKQVKWESKDYNFSFSHSHNFVCIAICKDKQSPLGVDIEKVQTRFDNLYKKFCTKKEIEQLKNEDNKTEQACLYWTKKESFFKSSSLENFIPSSIETFLYSSFYTYKFFDLSFLNTTVKYCVCVYSKQKVEFINIPDLEKEL